MKKIASFSGNFYVYNIPVTRQANIYECEEGKSLKGGRYEVSTHNGQPGAEWAFKPFKTKGEALAYATHHICPSVECKAVPEDK